ncbi:FAD binding domain-containing protein [Rhizomonospora bruguierae]|uniref:FAD binding domain-containing protein n=1 Tax=Rhizomonospora bruguierae TaxID=1581705 RepID=UPI001BCE7E46|nr:FAD binding domain-containing protein [Micromonospora sp. NBRC 107566]
MKPGPVTLRRPASVEECLDVLRSEREAVVKVISGGQSLMPLLALRMANPDVLVDIGRLDELIHLEVGPEAVTIGARVRHHQLTEEPLRSLLPVLAEAAGHIGHTAIRNRGTIGGSLAHADPAAELPAVMVLLGAEIECRSASAGTRLVPAAEFFTGPYLTTLADDELLTAVHVRRPGSGTGHGFVEFSPRHGDYARAGALATLSPGPGSRIAAARLVLFAVANRPVDVSEHVEVAVGARPEECDWASIAQAAVASLPAPIDTDRANRYRLALAAARRALRHAADRFAATRGHHGQ